MRTMTSNRWPLHGLRLRTPRLELRLPTLSELDALADLAALGVHDPDVQPFAVAWTDVSPDERALATLRHHWSMWAAWQPDDWRLNLVTVLDGTVVGSQGIGATGFAVLREVSTGSWLGQAYQGRGIGTEMRAAVLHLAFEGLGARYATSGAHEDNTASLRVSGKLGYADDGIERLVVRGVAAPPHRAGRAGRARTVPAALRRVHLMPG
jgi:RimJ/RimL family protein N-acetyltransferase